MLDMDARFPVTRNIKKALKIAFAQKIHKQNSFEAIKIA